MDPPGPAGTREKELRLVGICHKQLFHIYMETMNVVLINPYELGRQPFGLAEPAAWLQRKGCSVRCCDLSI